jgi:uncharacterized protein (DUF2384 family)
MSEAEKALIWCELCEILHPDDAKFWLDTPHPHLGDRRPRDCRFDEVMREIDILRSGAFA